MLTSVRLPAPGPQAAAIDGGCVEAVVQMLSLLRTEPSAVVCACEAFAALSARPETALRCLQKGAVEALSAPLLQHRSDATVLQSSCAAIRELLRADRDATAARAANLDMANTLARSVAEHMNAPVFLVRPPLPDRAPLPSNA